ncbi:MAG: NAD(P)/FAD-dependent oxidoreductase [Kutzneria sp.]|nr:NAD(P)/FAD-dependent oxidoreductase [Kutzneria sp.]
MRRIVIVGAGLAGASAAVALRERGFDGELTLFGQEWHRPYELPALSKGILLGDTDQPDWALDPSHDGEHGIRWCGGTQIVGLRPTDRVVVDASDAEHGYDRLLLATGSSPRRLPVDGGDLPGLHLLRRLDDALALRERLVAGARVVIVGAGWIGCEVAAAARKHDARVTMVDPLPLPLHAVLGDEVAAVFRDLHADNGVELRLGVAVDGFEGEGDTVRSVRLADGTRLEADVVVVGVGAAPRVRLAEQAGLTLAGGGVAVDAALRTSVSEIYAAGDIAAHAHPRYPQRVRVEHWANAKGQGTHVAGSLLGGEDPYSASPYFFSDQYDLGCEYRGLTDPRTAQLVVRGSLAAREFIAFWLRDSRVAAAMNVNSWGDGESLQALVDSGRQVTADQLVSGDLGELAGDTAAS